MLLHDRIVGMLERLYIQEYPIFQVLCRHNFVENRDIKCPVRCGKGLFEYNPDFIENISDNALMDLLKVEGIRILLRHPYERRLEGCSQGAMGLASNITIGDNYKGLSLNIETPQDMDFEEGKPYEYYALQLSSMEGGGGGGGGASQSSQGASPSSGSEGDTPLPSEKHNDLAGLWGEDVEYLTLIDDVIEKCENWGSLAGSFAEKLKASNKARIDWRKVFSGFRASVISSRRRLTRMRPNRRTGFQNMGSTREFTTRLLVAVDTSGSITSESLRYFYGVINSAFRYGFESIDVIQFDCGVRKVTKDIRKKIDDILVVGRGGTSFQEPVDYALENGYDGLLMLTDGFADHPVIPEGRKLPILWVCDCSRSYEVNHAWMEKLGRVCTIELR